MVLIRRSVFVIALFFTVNALEKARYDNYRVYKITVDDEIQLQLLKEIENFPDGVKFV